MSSCLPTPFVDGDHDLSPQRAASDYLLAPVPNTVPNAGEARFANSDHPPSIDRPAEFARILSGWLAENGL